MSALLATRVGMMLGDATASDGWRYAGWVAVDVRLLLFVAAISVLIAIGASALWIRSGRWFEFVAAFLLVLCVSFAGLVAIFNSIASYPVIVVERFFPFP
jgi:hypothetical protein